MNDKINDGGQAFPQPVITQGCAGMSLRDWFAGKVLAAIYLDSTNTNPIIAEEAYRAADAMIEARKKGK